MTVVKGLNQILEANKPIKNVSKGGRNLKEKRTMADYPLDKILLPMGAKEVKDEKKMETLWDNPAYIAEEKFDGVRMLSIGGRFFSRRISDIDGIPVEKTAQVPHLASVLEKYPNLILDGEVYYEGMTSNEVTSIMGSLPERAVALQEERGKLKYVAFDILRDFDGNWLIDLPWTKRRAALIKTIEQIHLDSAHDRNANGAYIELSTVQYDNKREFYNLIMERGGEGVILKNINGKYIPEKKPAWNWVKVKKHITDDVVIIGFKPPVREYEGKELDTWKYWEHVDEGGSQLVYDPTLEEFAHYDLTPVTKFYFNDWIGAVKFGKYDKDGNLVELGECSGLTDELRKDMSENPDKYIGQAIEIGAMERTKDGFYRHPQFIRMRPDKNPSECVLEEDEIKSSPRKSK